MESGAWPASLRQLTFFSPTCRSKALHGQRHFKGWFLILRESNQSIDNGGVASITPKASLGHAVWESLQQLSLGNIFNRSICRVVWRASLQGLTFGNSFNKRLAASRSQCRCNSWPLGKPSTSLLKVPSGQRCCNSRLSLKTATSRLARSCSQRRWKRLPSGPSLTSLLTERC